MDITCYIPLPIEDANWDDESLAQVYLQMSRMSFRDYADFIQPAFLAFCVTRDALSDYCKETGYPVPRFWFSPGDNGQRWTGARESAAVGWLKEIAAKPKTKSKSIYLADAQKHFPGMPADAFDRVWAKAAPADWRKPGRIPNRRSRN